VSCFACGSDRVRFVPSTPARFDEPASGGFYHCSVCGHDDDQDGEAQANHDRDREEYLADNRERELDF